VLVLELVAPLLFGLVDVEELLVAGLELLVTGAELDCVSTAG
jgi:hypothetical protein